MVPGWSRFEAPVLEDCRVGGDLWGVHPSEGSDCLREGGVNS